MTVIFITATGAGTFSAPGDWPGVATSVECIGGGAAGQPGNNTPANGAGGGGGSFAAFGHGAQGIIVITYTPTAAATWLYV